LISLIGEIEIPVGAVVFDVFDRRRGIAPRRIDLPLGHEAGVDEIAEHVVGARARGGQIDVRREFRRRLEQPASIAASARLTSRALLPK
jgi:hypothetical protein